MWTLRLLLVCCCVLLQCMVSFFIVPTAIFHRCISKRASYFVSPARTTADKDDDSLGYFRLPNDERTPDDLDNYFWEEGKEGKPSNGNVDEVTRKSIVRQLEFAFDHYQPWEVIEMSEKLFKMPDQFTKIRELCSRLDSLEAIAETQGWSENMVDILRSTRSEIRMYGKDTEFYDFEGNRNETPSIQFPFWPFGRR